MKAAVYARYGSPEVLKIEELPQPKPKPHELLIKVHAVNVSTGDCRLRRADPFAVRFVFGLLRPTRGILGEAFSGTVVATGDKVSAEFKPGDAVFGAMGIHFGAYAEYICMPHNGAVVHKPQEISHETAAAIPFGGGTAYHFLTKAKVQPGQRVLILGASGSVGSASVQVARAMGATVTAVCSAANESLVKSLGASQVMPYDRMDFTATNETFDVIFDTIGKAPLAKAIKRLVPGGIYLQAAAMLPQMLHGLWCSLTGSKKVISSVALQNRADLLVLQQMVVQGQLTPLVERVYPMEQIVEAHRHVETGRKKGNVVIRMD
jgi:NADPH:quinone reductase-like Zn-dependent oxidoreductase